MDSLPNELMQMILSYLSIKDAKSLSQTSKQMHTLNLSKIWKCPRFKKISINDFEKVLTKFPMEEIHTSDFDVNFEAKKTWEFFSRFKLLHIDHKDELPLCDLMKISFTGELVVHTRSLKIKDKNDFELFVDFVKSNNVTRLIIDHEYNWKIDFELQNQRPWTLDELKFISERIHISEVAAHCLDIGVDNFADFVDVFVSMGKFDLTMNSEMHVYNCRRHLFHIVDFELLIEKDIRLTYLNDLYLVRGFFDIGEFLPTLKRLKYMRELFVTKRVYVGSRCQWDLVELPIKSMTFDSFNIEFGRISNAINVLHNIKSLTYLEIPFHWTLYRMSVEEFALFKDLPVKKIEMGALDCLRLIKNRNELEKLREIMMQMKIEEITRIRGYKGFEIISHGPGGIYKSV